MAPLTAEQYNYLTQGIHPGRVRELRGQAHLEAWDVRRTLIRVFGFGGYDLETKSLDLVREIEHAPGTVTQTKWVNNQKVQQQNDRVLWTVVYLAEVRLTIKADDGSTLAVYEDGATGDSQNQPSLGDAHDQASKTALSQAMKRCAVNLGDQFGMSLYNKGSHQPVVVRSLVSPDNGPLPTVQDAPAVVGGEMDVDHPADQQETPTVAAPPGPESPVAVLLAECQAAALAAGIPWTTVGKQWAAENRGQAVGDVKDEKALTGLRDRLLAAKTKKGAA